MHQRTNSTNPQRMFQQSMRNSASLAKLILHMHRNYHFRARYILTPQLDLGTPIDLLANCGYLLCDLDL